MENLQNLPQVLDTIEAVRGQIEAMNSRKEASAKANMALETRIRSLNHEVVDLDLELAEVKRQLNSVRNEDLRKKRQISEAKLEEAKLMEKCLKEDLAEVNVEVSSALEALDQAKDAKFVEFAQILHFGVEEIVQKINGVKISGQNLQNCDPEILDMQKLKEKIAKLREENEKFVKMLQN